ncbi:MAG TPA: penicillin-binding protein 1C [Vicinamibacterales bacterium]|nr:penicillin-binding protein 1C [Vicinamibacterales bacterium]
MIRVTGLLTYLRRRIRSKWVTAATVAAIGTGVWLRCGALPAGLLDGVDTPSTVVVDRHGRVLYEALTSSGSRVDPLSADALPAVLVDATLAAEDRRFYSHIGVDPVAMLRALRQNLAERQVVEGGSTITQQAAKLLLQRREGVRPRGLRAKLRELVIALRLEHRLTKREILALYLNLASYGNQAAGAGRASQIYFGVDASMLTPAQAGFLAALPQRPTAFNPWRNFASARRRQQTVLHRMAAAGTLSPERLIEAREERIALRPRQATFNAPHFVEMVRSAAGPAATRVQTTLDLDLQREVERIVEQARPALRAHGAANAAVIVLDNASGEWLAWEGSGNYGDVEGGGSINGPLVPRQPGSALKPFTYALAFEHGYGPASVLPDLATHFATAEPGVLYSPRNYDGRYHGPMLARRALAGSQNVPAVALASEMGVSALLRFLSRAGLSTFDRAPGYYGLGLTLGNAEVRLDELVAAYASFARGGVWTRPAFLREEGSRRTGETEAERSSGRQSGDQRTLVSPETAFLITDILSDPRAREDAFGRGSDLDFPFAVAAKTGTSQAYHDNWTIGYTRDVTIGVWVGNFDRTPLRNSSGVTGAGPIFHQVMLAAAKGRESATAHAILPAPQGLERTNICMLSGQRANAWCPSRSAEWSVKGSDPVPCSWHHASDGELLTIYPPEYRAWASASPRASADGSGAFRARVDGGTDAPAAATRRIAALQIANPPAGAIYSIDPTLRREFQALPLRATTERPTTVTWLVDGAMIGTSSSERALAWPLAVGTHQIEVRDADGRRARASVVVK